MYKRIKLTLAKRSTIAVGAVVGLDVNEVVEVPTSLSGDQTYATLHLRKQHAMKGLIQTVTTPLPDGWLGKPCVVVKNDSATLFELLEGEEIGEVWVFS